MVLEQKNSKEPCDARLGNEIMWKDMELFECFEIGKNEKRLSLKKGKQSKKVFSVELRVSIIQLVKNSFANNLNATKPDC